MLAYRSSVHRILEETPCAMMLGQEIALPMNTFVGPPLEEGCLAFGRNSLYLCLRASSVVVGDSVV